MNVAKNGNWLTRLANRTLIKWYQYISHILKHNLYFKQSEFKSKHNDWKKNEVSMLITLYECRSILITIIIKKKYDSGAFRSYCNMDGNNNNRSTLAFKNEFDSVTRTMHARYVFGQLVVISRRRRHRILMVRAHARSWSIDPSSIRRSADLCSIHASRCIRAIKSRHNGTRRFV